MHYDVRSPWWVFVLRGAAAVLFGILALSWPSAALLTLVLLFGLFAFVDGIGHAVAAAHGLRRHGPWGLHVFAALAGIAAGILAYVRPGETAFALAVVIGVWAILTGIVQLVVAVGARRELTGEWLLGLTGALGIAFGVLILARPFAGLLAVIWMIAAYALASGFLLLGLGLWALSARRREPTLPTTPAVPPTTPTTPTTPLPV